MANSVREVKSHWKTYTQDKPLFGRVVGTIQWGKQGKRRHSFTGELLDYRESRTVAISECRFCGRQHKVKPRIVRLTESLTGGPCGKRCFARSCSLAYGSAYDLFLDDSQRVVAESVGLRRIAQPFRRNTIDVACPEYRGERMVVYEMPWPPLFFRRNWKGASKGFVACYRSRLPYLEFEVWYATDAGHWSAGQYHVTRTDSRYGGHAVDVRRGQIETPNSGGMRVRPHHTMLRALEEGAELLSL